MSQNVNSLFANAVAAGDLTAGAVGALNIPDIGNQIQLALGTPAIDVQTAEVFLVTLLVDDSGSISGAGNEQVVRDGVNLVIDSLMASKQRDTILMHIKYLNGQILVPYVPLLQVPKLTTANYTADGGTPLYDQTAVILGTVMAKSVEFSDQGVPVRSATMVITDGHDQHSHSQTPASVAKVVKDMLMREMHIISAMGVDDGSTNFTDVFTQMGFEQKWILTPANTPTEIRRAFNAFSQSAVRASQGANSFSKTALGGFGQQP